MSQFWHPFANMGTVADDELVLVRGRGSTITDSKGRELIDAAGGLWYCNVGHGRSEIADAAAGQIKTLESCSCFEDVVNEPAGRLANRVAALSPIAGAKVFFTSGGSDAVDTAAKLSRRYWAAMGKPSKLAIISRDGCYHGAHSMGTSLAGIEANREGFGPLVRETARVPKFDAQALADQIDALDPDNVAAFFAEPVINAGVWAPQDDFLAQARQVCAERDVLFVADEVVTGFGRLGRWFASERYGIQPDMILFAKGITSGYLPLGGVIVAPRVAEPFWAADAPLFRHGYTYSGHATCCAAGEANLDIMAAERLPERVAQLEGQFTDILTSLLDESAVTAVRTAGFAGAVQIDPSLVEADPTLPRRLIVTLRDHGVLTRTLSGFALQISPPLVITIEELERVAEGIRRSLHEAVKKASVAV